MNRSFQQDTEDYTQKDKTREMRRQLDKKFRVKKETPKNKKGNPLKNRINEMRIRELMEEI